MFHIKNNSRGRAIHLLPSLHVCIHSESLSHSTVQRSALKIRPGVAVHRGSTPRGNWNSNRVAGIRPGLLWGEAIVYGPLGLERAERRWGSSGSSVLMLDFSGSSWGVQHSFLCELWPLRFLAASCPPVMNVHSEPGAKKQFLREGNKVHHGLQYILQSPWAVKNCK